MSKTDHKANTKHFVESYNKGRASAMTMIDEFYATDLVFHNATGKDLHGTKEFKQMINGLFDAFPDGRMTLDDVFSEGDKVAVRYTMSGTHKGQYMGVPPTNKKVTVSLTSISRSAGGKIKEVWQTYDTFGVMQQLGVAPKPKGK